MKLLMISGDRSILQGKRGAFWYMLEEMGKHWERIDVICPSPSFPFSRGEGELQGGRIRLHPSPHRLWYQPWWIFRRGRELIAEHRHDVMTVHEYPPFYNGIGARRLLRETGISAVLEVHHIVGHPRAASPAEWVGKHLSRFSLARGARPFSAVRTVNSSVGDWLAERGVPREKIRVVPSFYLDVDLLGREEANMPDVDLVSCARLVSHKGLFPLLEALRLLPGVSLLVIGDGPLRRRAENFISTHGLTERVAFTGWLPSQEEVIATLRRGRIFVMNSLSEGGPRAALEAMACGLPVIATPVGVMPEVIREGETGLLTDGSPRDLVGKIRLLLGDAILRERMGRGARRILERFERKKLIREYAEFLKSVVRA